MLVELSYISKNPAEEKAEPQPIRFDKGANFLYFDYEGKKMVDAALMYLYLIDYAYGGDKYTDLNLCKARSILGEHTVRIVFRYGEKDMLFSRDTDEPKTVTQYGNEFNEAWSWPIPINEYNDILRQQCGLLDKESKLTAISKIFTHVYPGGRIPSRLFYNTLVSGKTAKLLATLEWLYSKHDYLQTFRDQHNDKEDRLKSYEKAQEYRYIEPVVSESTYKDNESTITELSSKSASMELDIDEEITEETMDNADEELDVRKKLSYLHAERYSYVAKLKAIERNIEEAQMPLLTDDFGDLQRFFPDAEIQAFTSVEEFHQKISQSLQSKLATEKNRIIARIQSIETEIRNVERKERETGNLTNISRQKLDEYKGIDKRISKIQEQNRNYVRYSDIKNAEKEARDILNTNEDECHDSFASMINVEIERLLSAVPEIAYASAPQLVISRDTRGEEQYNLECSAEKDTHLSVFLFEIAILNTSSLPYLILDSTMLRSIASTTGVEVIMRVVNESEKQVFAVFDDKVKKSEKEYEQNNHIALSDVLCGFYGEDIGRLLRESRL